MSILDGTVLGTTKIVDRGLASEKFNLVILSDGYQASEMAQFEADAQSLVDYLFTTSPFNDLELQCAFNVYRINVTSTDSGADDPAGSCGGLDTTAATYFDATFCGDGAIRRLLTVNNATVTSVLNAQVPEWDQGIVIVNSSIYGGSGGQIGVFSTGGNWREVAIHELGHSAFGLADEYEYYQGCGIDTDRNNHPGAEPAEANVTVNSNRATIKWGDLIAAATPMPTTSNADCTQCDPQASSVPAGTVGAFEGAHYYHCGAFRPEYNCKMRSLSNPFCAVCERRIRKVLAPYSSPTTVTLDTLSINFNDVPEGTTTVRAAVFTISSCLTLNFQIVSSPTVLTGPPGTTFGTPLGTTVSSSPGVNPRHVNVWISYTGTNNGDIATGTVTIRCLETGQDYVIPIAANTVSRPTVAVMLVLDKSGSMLDDAGDGRTRIDVLRESAGVFVDVIQEDNGIGVVRFATDAEPTMDVDLVGPPIFGTGRVNARAAVSGHTPDPSGLTAIGDGVELGSANLSMATGFDERAMIVLTDGQETAAKYISEVSGLISSNPRIFGIGLGTAEQIQPAALNALTNGNNGYLLMTGTLDANDYFRLSKYYLQILAGVTNSDIVLDPEGYVLPGQIHRIPFLLNETDIDSDIVLLSPAPSVFRFQLETPSGQIIEPSLAGTIPGLSFIAGSRNSYYRVTLPVLVEGVASREGLWHAVLTIDEKLYKRYLSSLDNYPDLLRSTQAHGMRYSLNVYSYSNLRMRARLLQNSLEPGALLTVRAVLTEYDLPIQQRATVRADMKRPDGTTAVVSLSEVEPGVFETSTIASIPGTYYFRIQSKGKTLRDRPFTREQIVTGVVWQGGDNPFPEGEENSKDESLCRLLKCLSSREVLSPKFEEVLKERGINLEVFRKCLEVCCGKKQSRLVGDISTQRLSEVIGSEMSGLIRSLAAQIEQER